MTFVPAPGQGTLAIEAYDDRDDLKADFSSLLDLDFIRLRQLEFDLISDVGLTCNYPLGCYFYYQNGQGFCRIFLADFDLNVKLDTLWSFNVLEADSFVAEKKAYLRTLL